MNSKDKDQTIERYRQRLAQYGKDIRALASGTPARQAIRFEVLSGVGDLAGASILDLGCGFGDFLQFLTDRGVDVDYTGYDISPDLIELASSRFPSARFETRDIQESGLGGRFDYIVCSQTFNFRLKNEDNFEIMRDVLARCLDGANKGVVIDFLTSYVDYQEDHHYYYDPEQVFSFAKTLTKRVALRHDYPLFEFAIYLYPDFRSWNV